MADAEVPGSSVASILANASSAPSNFSGYVLPFMSVPKSRRFKNQKSALENADFVSEALLAMLSDGHVKEVDNPPIVCSLLLVIDKMGKKHLVINLHYINQFIARDTFKYEDIRTGILMFKQAILCVPLI